MAKKRKLLIELPRRVTAYYLLFCVIAIVWLMCGAVEIAQSILLARSEGAVLRALNRGASRIGLAYVRAGNEGVQQALSKITSTHSGLAYGYVVSLEGKLVADTRANRPVGRSFRATPGKVIQWGDVQLNRFADGTTRIREYRQPLAKSGQPLGAIYLAINEPGLWQTAYASARLAPFMTFGVISLFAFGGIVLYRTVHPLADIDFQLRNIARSTSPMDANLTRVPIRGSAAIGWNHLVERCLIGGDSAAPLEAQLTQAVAEMGKKKTDYVLNSLNEGIAVTDDEGRVEFANPAMAALLGEENADEFTGKTMEFVLALETLDPESQLLLPELASRTVITEVRLPPVEGMEPPILRIARTCIRDTEANKLPGHIWSIRDITQQKLAEDMRAQFLDSAIHELRTPLATIKAYAETMAEGGLEDIEEIKGFCNIINGEVTRLARFIDDLLSVSSMEVGSLAASRQEVDVERLLRDMAQKVRPQMEAKDITFEEDLADKLPELYLDKDKITAALVNLLGNAAKYTPDGGHVVLRVRSDENALQIKVKDSGLGIAPEELPKVFDKFFRSDDPRVQDITGTGLGLAFANEVVRLHGGRIEVESEVDLGTTFTVTLPLS